MAFEFICPIFSEITFLLPRQAKYLNTWPLMSQQVLKSNTTCLETIHLRYIKQHDNPILHSRVHSATERDKLRIQSTCKALNCRQLISAPAKIIIMLKIELLECIARNTVCQLSFLHFQGQFMTFDDRALNSHRFLHLLYFLWCQINKKMAAVLPGH